MTHIYDKICKMYRFQRQICHGASTFGHSEVPEVFHCYPNIQKIKSNLGALHPFPEKWPNRKWKFLHYEKRIFQEIGIGIRNRIGCSLISSKIINFYCLITRSGHKLSTRSLKSAHFFHKYANFFTHFSRHIADIAHIGIHRSDRLGWPLILRKLIDFYCEITRSGHKMMSIRSLKSAFFL